MLNTVLAVMEVRTFKHEPFASLQVEGQYSNSSYMYDLIILCNTGIRFVLIIFCPDASFRPQSFTSRDGKVRSDMITVHQLASEQVTYLSCLCEK